MKKKLRNKLVQTMVSTSPHKKKECTVFPLSQQGEHIVLSQSLILSHYSKLLAQKKHTLLKITHHLKPNDLLHPSKEMQQRNKMKRNRSLNVYVLSCRLCFNTRYVDMVSTREMVIICKKKTLTS